MGRARRIKSIRSMIRSSSHSKLETRYSVDVAHLLFTRKRDFLVKSNGQKVKKVDLKGKTIVLFIAPLYEEKDFLEPWEKDYLDSWGTLDMIDAYNELLPLGSVEFVFVPVYLSNMKYYVSPNPSHSASKEAIYNNLLSTMPWPAIPFYDVESCGRRVAKTFCVDRPFQIPYWVIIDPTGTVVATKSLFNDLFKLFAGAELYPLSGQRICTLRDDFDPWTACNKYGHYYRCESRKRIINKWDELLASPIRDFLLSSNDDRVPISSLQSKVIGLYFCENIQCPNRMEVIKEVYEKAKLRGYAFEIVQINFHYHFFKAYHTKRADLTVEQLYENVNWLRLPFKDPSCRKLQRMSECKFDEEYKNWYGDCLVIIDPRQADSTGVLFEFSGAEIFGEYGIEGYPFTRQSLLEMAHRREKKELRLQTVFPPGECHFIRPVGHGFDSADDSQLRGKKVLVLLGEREYKSSEFVSMLKSKYREQQNDEAEVDKLKVVYVSVAYKYDESSFNECIKDMPWLVHPYSREFGLCCRSKIFKYGSVSIGAAAFGIDGGLIAKERGFLFGWGENEEADKFPFVSQDWEWWINNEIEARCQLDKYNYHTSH